MPYVMLVDNFGGVRLDGSNATIIGSGRGEFIADRNNIARVWMDHGFWPLHTTALAVIVMRQKGAAVNAAQDRLKSNPAHIAVKPFIPG